MICTYITELVEYGIRNGLVPEADRIYTVNRLIELFGLEEYICPDEVPSPRDLHLILEDMISEALDRGILKSDTTASKDLFDTKIMGLLTPPPSVVISKFSELYENDPKEATDWYYSFSKATNYIRTDRIAKDVKWLSSTRYGDMDITINLSKPEKDPRDIAAAGKAKSTSYPKCLLCPENEGYAGTLSHPARQNHRIIPITLDGDRYYLVMREPAPPKRVTREERIRQRVDKFFAWLDENGIRPVMIDICRSRISGYCPADRWELVEELVMEELGKRFPLQMRDDILELLG